MSEEEKYKSIIQEIKDIYLYLTQGEPTPDDEITARDKIIKQIETLNSVKTFNVESNLPLFEDTLNKLENWDTLELWFVESELPEYVEKIINITNELPEFKPKDEIKESPTTRLHEDLETASFDIDQIVDKVSEQFKGEIDDLKQKIDILKTELEKKDETLKQVAQSKVIKKITPKKDIKLPPPKIKLPTIKKPDQPPHIKAPTRTEEEKSKKFIGVQSIEHVQSKIEEELEKLNMSSILEDTHEKEEETFIKSQHQEVISEIIKDSESILDILEESETSIEAPEVPTFTEMPEKPKKSSLIPEIIEVETSEKETEIPFAIKEPEIIQKPKTTSKPKITSVSIEEIEAEEIRSTGAELFNVFSSVGDKTAEKLPTLDEAFSSEVIKEKKKKDDKKKKKGEKGETYKTDAMPFVDFGGTEPEISSHLESEIETEEELPSDKDSLYQELIALEGKRYSLEKSFKELERSYSTGSIDDFEYKNQSDELRQKLNSITSKINKIRRVIASI
ncbi:MAG: hypothetical protein JSV62_12785 [Promethearchaeota archaeon]|nr:MAG: hypothetical protein JSV62_12785 [Candidatus Lokiarchaeota archaeon]